MSLRRWVAAFVVAAAAATGCDPASRPAPVMPDVLGESLEVARSDIERAGVDDEVEVLGGGLLGIVDEANWQVRVSNDQPPAMR